MSKALVNKIIPSSVVDGPGNRTAIFLQGCNLRCAYCHNPETQNLCINCGDCVNVCPTGSLTLENKIVHYNEETCVNCDKCIDTCKNYSTPKTKSMTADEVYSVIQKGSPFIRGITVSGGECTLYPEFLLELFKKVKNDNLDCLIDSNGRTDLSLYDELIDCCDGVMLDVKSWNTRVFQHLTGYDNDVVKRNLKYLSDKDKLAEIRIVIIENEVDAVNVLEGVASLLGKDKINSLLVKLIRFRNIGVKGRMSNTPTPSFSYIMSLQKHAINLGFENIVII